MANAFSSMEYPHWLIVAGAVLLVLGLVGLALRQRGNEAELDDMASDQEASEPETELVPTEAANWKAEREERKRDRWANNDRGTDEPLSDRPKVTHEESKWPS